MALSQLEYLNAKLNAQGHLLELFFGLYFATMSEQQAEAVHAEIVSKARSWDLKAALEPSQIPENAMEQCERASQIVDEILASSMNRARLINQAETP